MPKENDSALFPKRIFHKDESDFSFTIPAIDPGYGTKIKVEERSLDPSGLTLDETLKLHNTLSLLIIRNDSILYERYAKMYQIKLCC